MGTTDEFGNYSFKMNNVEYFIQAVQWRDKRVLRGKMVKVLTPEGELDPFSEGFYDLQDWVLSKVSYTSGEAMIYLKTESDIENHFNAINVDILDGVDQVFNEALGYLAGNFITPAVEPSDPVNSTVDAGDSSKSQNIPRPLSETLKA